MSPREFVYRIDTAARGAMPGAHRSAGGDRGMEFRAHASLMDAPDVRRLDLMASLRDPMAAEHGRWLVRLYKQRKSIPVAMVADLSASMGFVGAQRRPAVLADFATALARSAQRIGDGFGFIGCAEQVLDRPRLPVTRARGAGEALAAQLRASQPAGHGAQGLLQAWRHLGRQRALVFLVSDFHLDDALIDRTLDALAAHDVVPVVLWDTQEWQPTPATRAGRALLPLRDAETGREHMVWWRPALAERWAEAGLARRAALTALFQSHRRRPLFMQGAFDADAVTRHFMA
jgi:hypothetical protein